MVKLGSLFDGIGGFPLSAIQHGIEPVWASEIEPFPIVVTKKHFPNMKHLGDITQINGAEIEPVEIITGGSPCQDLSVAGKRAGLAGERSGLFMEQVRIVKEMREHDRATGRSTESIRPRFMVWENVPGAFSSNGGEDFRAVLEETARIADETVTIPRPRNDKWDSAGAIMGRNFSLAWRVIDAQYWGVPQRRRRIFLVADFGGQSAPEILFKCKGLSRHITESRKTREEVATNIGTGIESAEYDWGTGDRIGGWIEREDRIFAYQSDKKRSTVQEHIYHKECGKADSLTHQKQNVMAIVQKLYEPHPNDSRITGPVDIAPTISQRYGTGGNNTPLVQNIDCTPNVYREGSFGDYVEGEFGTLKASGGVLAGGSEAFVSQSYTVRRLTPTECERLQGFPDDWTNIPGTKKVSKEELEFWRGVWYEWDKMQSEKPEEVSPRTDKAILR